MKIYILVGTRPNFIKVTRFKKCAAAISNDIDIRIIHTGQHYDEKMADVFFKQFDLIPDHYLNIGQTSTNTQMADIMQKLESLLNQIGKPDILLVPGDVNSTLAGALVANKCNIRLGHIEAGLRSFDRTMPEEINRILTDEITDLYFVTEPSGMEHLQKEGKNTDHIHFVGNTMIDTMVAFDAQIKASSITKELGIEGFPFILMTMHRPATVDHKSEMKKLLDLIKHLSSTYHIVFPIHPRTIKNSREFGLHDELMHNKDLICTDPLDYFAFQKLICDCKFIITDSGGIQEESTFRRKPCLTIRPNTERPVTVDTGTNILLNFDINEVMKQVKLIEDGHFKKGSIPHFWDGHSTERILNVLLKK